METAKATRGAPKGNNNPGKNKPWTDALKRALLRNEGKDLEAIAQKVIEMAKDGDIQAIREVGDRVEGKAVQSVEQKTEITGAVEIAERPKLTKEEWLRAHGLGTATGAAE